MADRLTVAQVNDKVFLLQGEHEKLKKIVVGNGEPGMDENVRGIGKDLTDLRDLVKTYIQTEQSNRQYYTRLFVGIFAAQAIAAIIAGAVLLVRLAPLIDKLQSVSL